MRPILGNTSSEGKKPTTPTIGTATAGEASASVSFTESTYRGKTNSGTYRATSTPGSITGTCTAPCSSITVTGLNNGTAYTFTVQLETPYGVNSDLSASSNSVTPVAPPSFPFFPPFFPFFPEFTTPPFFPFFPFFPEFTTTPPPPPTFTCTALAAANGACAESQVNTGCVATFFAFNEQC